MNKHLPDKAIDLLDEACARKSTLIQKLESSDEYKKYEKQIEELDAKIEEAINNQDYFTAAELKKKVDLLKQKIRKIRQEMVLPKHLRPTVTAEDI
jgi:ATP-dependent Clp protease ATP-binding subunit ClpC